MQMSTQRERLTGTDDAYPFATRLNPGVIKLHTNRKRTILRQLSVMYVLSGRVRPIDVVFNSQVASRTSSGDVPTEGQSVGIGQ